MAHHLVAFEASVAGTKEHVNIDGAGRVRSIHRYYEPATWPFIAGVAASLVPVSSSLLLSRTRSRVSGRTAPATRREWRTESRRRRRGRGLGLDQRQWAARRDGALRDGGGEPRRGRRGGSATLLVGEGHSIAPTARILGPVVIHPDVRIGEHATIVGPALIGAGAQVSTGAIVAHAIVGPHSQVPQDCTIRDRVWFNSLDDPDEVRASGVLVSGRDWNGSVSSGHDECDQRGRGCVPLLASPLEAAIRRRCRFLGLVLLSPLLPAGRGPGPARVARAHPLPRRAGRPWRDGYSSCLKFRTMQEGAHGVQHLLKAQDKLDGPHFKLDRRSAGHACGPDTPLD